MHLKRDTDYALRILLYIAEYLRKNRGSSGVISSEIVSKTGVPMVSYSRISEILEMNEVIQKITNNEGEIRIYPGRRFWEQNLKSIAEMVERNIDIFLLFDWNYYHLLSYGHQLNQVQRVLDKALHEVTISSLIESET